MLGNHSNVTWLLRRLKVNIIKLNKHGDVFRNWLCPNFLSLPNKSELPKIWGGCRPPAPPPPSPYAYGSRDPPYFLINRAEHSHGLFIFYDNALLSNFWKKLYFQSEQVFTLLKRSLKLANCNPFKIWPNGLIGWITQKLSKLSRHRSYHKVKQAKCSVKLNAEEIYFFTSKVIFKVKSAFSIRPNCD